MSNIIRIVLWLLNIKQFFCIISTSHALFITLPVRRIVDRHRQQAKRKNEAIRMKTQSLTGSEMQREGDTKTARNEGQRTKKLYINKVFSLQKNAKKYC